VTVAITRLELSATDLEEAAAYTRNARAAHRMLAIALVLQGWSRQAAAVASAMDDRTLRHWVRRYNEAGLDGLYDRARHKGAPPRLSAEQQATVIKWVEEGPELKRDGVARWRYIDLQGRIKEEFGVELHVSTLSKVLHHHNIIRLRLRPYHPRKIVLPRRHLQKTLPSGSRGGVSCC
jgi:transposase